MTRTYWIEGRKHETEPISFSPEIVQKFWSRVDQSKRDGCWLWAASSTVKGYGLFVFRGKVSSAHRMAWEMEAGVRLTMNALHHCDNPECVRPSHLYAGTSQQNMDDMIARNRNRYGQEARGAQLTDRQVLEARELYTKHRTCREIADRIGVPTNTIYMAVSGRTYKRVTEKTARD